MRDVDAKGKYVFWIQRQRGAGMIKALVLTPLVFVLMAVLVFAFYEGRKAYWDYRVREMCEKDGGIKVYENAELPEMYMKNNDVIRIPFEANATEIDEYFIRTTREPIVEGNLSVGKHLTQIIRARDRKIMAESITYGRGGGDFPTFAHPSYMSCLTNGNSFDSMIHQVFNSDKR